MSYYESVFIARQDLTAVQVDGLTETFEKIITDMGGSVPKKESWGLRSMAYKIKKNRKGHYVLMNLDAPGDAIKEMERQMHLNEDVLRHLVTRVDELEEGPSAVLRAKERGDDRGRRGDRDGGRGFSKPGPQPKDAAKEEDAPKADDAKAGKTEAKDTKADDAGAGKTKAEDTKAEDTKADDAKAEDTKADGTKAEDAKAEDTKADDTKAEDTKAEDTKADDTKAETDEGDEK